MGSAAGAGIAAGNVDDPHLAGQLFFAPVVQVLKLLWRGEMLFHRNVVPDHSVGHVLQLLQLLHGQKAVEIDGHLILSHVKSHVVVAVTAVNQTGQNVFPRVVLHMVITPLPVDNTFRQAARLQGRLHLMPDLPVLLADVAHQNAVQGAGVRGLSASLRVKTGLV